jgi:RNA polymerase sigma-70 factor (ECF subfamily)
MAPEGTIPDRALFDNLVGAEVEEALSKVPADFRMTVLLSDVEGMTYEEIAEATNVPVGTVRSRLARGRAILRRELEQFALARGYVKKEDLE